MKKSRVFVLLESPPKALNARRSWLRDGALISSSNVESSVKNPKRAYISTASLRKLKESSSTPLWKRLLYCTSGESKNFKSRRPNSLLFSPSPCVTARKAPIFIGLSTPENMTRKLVIKVGKWPPSDAVTNPRRAETSSAPLRKSKNLRIYERFLVLFLVDLWEGNLGMKKL